MSVVGKMRLADDLHFTTANTGFFGLDSSGAYSRRMTFPEASSGSGILHGTWVSDTPISTSDRRMKKNIKPLYTALIDKHAARDPSKKQERTTEQQASAAIGWILRELRPVSFNFRAGADAKAMGPRYGFVAQEVERVLPDLVQELGSTKHLVYQDLIAMITLAAQDHQKRLETHHGEVSKLKGMVKQLAGALGHLSQRVTRIVASGAGGAANDDDGPAS